MSLRRFFHDRSFGFLFLSTSIASGKNPAKRYAQASKAPGTPAGGEAQDLAV